MKMMRMTPLAILLLLIVNGCLSIKTEHEIKPIQITLDINLKIERDLENFLNLDK
jgi:hypothetical protein